MNPIKPYRILGRRLSQGLTLIELMVALVIGLTLTLAMTMITVRYESGKRVLGTANDMTANGNFISYELDRQLRSAGSGYVQGWRDNLGCLLRVSRNGQQILPRLGPFPAPFDTLPQQVRLAPVLVFPGAGNGDSDVIAIATGTSGLAETTSTVLPNSTTATSLRMPNTVGMRGGDLMLVAETGVGCMMQEVASPFAGGATQQLNLDGVYASSVINGLAMADFAKTGSASVAALGNVAGNQPSFQLLGMNADSALVSYDLLQLGGQDAVQVMADGIADLRVIYGIDSTPNNLLFTVDQWVTPTGDFAPAALTDGSAAAQARLMSIMAVRVGMVLRSDRVEKEGEEVAPDKLTLFAGMPAALQVEVKIESLQQRQRHRTVEFTVPLRNIMLTVRP
ncbi:PilW family protein [Roseateles cavernae]|uniref:PilW family protein n=1 Tax=Roseateles cavernae TaxID=3153578 RepID=UPI0032E3919E